MVVPGTLVVFTCLVVGFMMAGGNMLALFQPAEFVTILGMSFGALIISTPMAIFKRCLCLLSSSFRGSHINEKSYSEMLVMLYRLFALARKNGTLALESHISEPEKSDLFTKFPGMLHNKPAMELLTETMRLIVDGSAQPDEIESLMENSIETFEMEAHMPLSVLQKVGDGLPGIGIVGAVLGIIITMSKIDGKPDEVGHHVAAALVGTFLGVFVAYGLLNPLVTAIQQKDAEETCFLNVMKTAIASFSTGASPTVAVEFARRSIFSYSRPTAVSLEKACKAGA